MKINRLFSIAAAALMMVACSSEETALKNNPAAGSQMPFTATIAVPGSGAGTRTAYTESGTDINVTWSVGDEIALIHNGVKDVATVKTINADGSATITGFITKAENEAGVELVYPSALVTSVTNDGPVFDNDLLGRISTQDGTLKYIQDNLDFRRAKGQLSVNETSATLKEAATMNSMHAIWKLTLQNDDETPVALSAKQVSVQLTADVPILRARTAELTTPISSFYLAMEPFTEAPITIEATVGEDTYSYTNEVTSLERGKYYQSTVTMTKASAEITVTITQKDLPPTGNKSFTKDGVTVTAGNMIPSGNTIMGPGSFTTTLGNFTKIEVTGDDKPTGWTSGVWTGNASTVEFTGTISGLMSGAFTIVCTIQPAEAATETEDMLTTPLTLKVTTGGEIVVKNPKSGLKYSLNGGEKQNVTEGTTYSINVSEGDKVSFYCNGFSNSSTSTVFSGTGSVRYKVYGNIMSLLDEENFATTTPSLTAACFKGLFKGDSYLTDASGLLLPAETLDRMCYQEMFRNCSALTTAPELPATTLDQYCYYYMFGGCSVLTTAPKLPATDLVKYCYAHMFDNCDNLTDAYVKAAYTASNNECSGMLWYGKVSAVLHTTSENKASWADAITSNYWSTWTTADDWTD